MAEEETFKVIDRRGRGGEVASTAAGSAAPARETPEPAREPAAEPRPPHAHAGAREKPDLQGLFVMFATSALINLGQAPDPASGERHVDLEQAQEAIDLLLLLREKTQGNRTEQESRVLEQVVYDLQMRYVQAASARPV
jgi:hypothetical protein